jgi:hypothetical protein
MTTQDEVNTYLDDLREEGSVNMFGAAPYLVEDFGITSKEARAMLGVWMKTYSKRHPTAPSTTQGESK